MALTGITLCWRAEKYSGSMQNLPRLGGVLVTMAGAEAGCQKTCPDVQKPDTDFVLEEAVVRHVGAVFDLLSRFPSGKRCACRPWHDYCTSRKDGVCTQGLEKTQVTKAHNIIELLEAGVRAESLRQRAIASNIANLETAGYRRIDVRFEESLAKALHSARPVNIRDIEPLLYRPEQTPVKSNGNDVNLETEVGQMVKNTLRHKAYIRLLDKKYKQIELAIDMR